MTTYYKATRPDGRDFHTGTVDYAAALASGTVVRHPVKVRDRRKNDASTYLSVSVEPADCTGFSWPCRLFRVEPVGTVLEGIDYPNKRGVSRLRVVEELPAHMALGPNGEQVVAFLARLATLTPDQAGKLRAARAAARDAAWAAAWAAAWDATWAAARDATWAAARDAAWAAARDAAWAAARDAARDAARAAAWDAAWAAWDATWAIVVRDLITTEQYAVLVQPFVDAGLGEWVA